jgi:hypothetical protein
MKTLIVILNNLIYVNFKSLMDPNVQFKNLTSKKNFKVKIYDRYGTTKKKSSY